MYSHVLSVPDAVRGILANNNMYFQALELGIANYTALAEKIKPEIEKLVGSKVNLNTIVVAIKRFADTLEKKQIVKPSKGTASAKMSLTGSIIDLNFQKEQEDDLTKILDQFFEQESRYSLFQTDSNFTLFAEDVEEIRDMLSAVSKKFDGKIREGLSKISMALSPDEQRPYYLLSLISNILYEHQIPVHSAFFTPDEMVLILNQRDAAKAYELIRIRIG
jgi:hypothetical protein